MTLYEFYSRFFEQEYHRSSDRPGMDYEDFITYLVDSRVLQRDGDTISVYGSRPSYLNDDLSFIPGYETEFYIRISERLKKYYSWNEAIEETGCSEEKFMEVMAELGLLDPEDGCYTEGALEDGYVTDFCLLKQEAIDAVEH